MAIVPVTITNATSTIKRAYYSMSLEKTKGKVISSNVQKELKKGFFSGVTTTYRAHITYVYNVDGASYLGRGIEFEDPSFSTNNKALRLVKKYPLNRRIIIFYSTINPDKSVIIKPNTTKPLIFTILGTLAGLYMTMTGVFFIMGGGIKNLKAELNKPKTVEPKQAEQKPERPLRPAAAKPNEPKTTVAQTPEPEPTAPIMKPPPSKTGLKPPAAAPEKVVIKKPTANPISTGKATNEARPKIVTTTSLKPPANKPKK